MKPDSFERPNPVSARAGIGLRAPHYREILETLPDIGWLEVHSENFFGEGGQPLYFLEQIAKHYHLSLHGVGLFPGSVDPLDRLHLEKLKSLVQRFDPMFVSEHVSWGSVGGRFLNDLMPLPLTEEALDHFCSRVDQIQNFLSRQILIENVSTYLEFRHSTIPEWEFLSEIANSTKCGILLDVNNIYVNAVNHRFDPEHYLLAVPVDAVQEIHLAGFDSNGICLIDTHGNPVFPQVWKLYQKAVQRFGAVPTLVEWDTDIPDLSVLLEEMRKARNILEKRHVRFK